MQKFVKTVKKPQIITGNIIKSIHAVLHNDGRVAEAWLFGSIARGEEKVNSDVDIMVEMNNAKNYSMFDLLDIAFIIESKINRKVDLVEKDALKGFAMKTALNDMIKNLWISQAQKKEWNMCLSQYN